jgi:selenocysteine-specific elongation factor
MPQLVIGTAGHIDHGKSALVRALTGIEPDRLKEEQERGITIDLGFAHAIVGDAHLAFVDVPGHERFVRNMLAGATGIDAVLLVVAADESVMPQTREHLDICRLLEVGAGVIALTKCDVADPDLRAVARDETRALVAGTFLEHAPIVEVSSTTGDGLDTLRRELAALAARITSRPVDGPVRLPIDRVFTLRGFGTIVTGTLVSGTIRASDPLTLLPRGHTPRVRGLHVHGHAATEAVAGERVAVNVGDLQVRDITRGDTLVATGAFEATRRLDVRIETLADAPPLRHAARVRFHQGTSEVMGRVAIARVLDVPREMPSGVLFPGPAVESEVTPDVVSAVVPPGRCAYARIRLEAEVVVTRGDRFVLRSYSPMATIGGGLVLDPLPRRSGLRSPASRARFEQLDARGDDTAARACVAIVADEGPNGMTWPRLVARMGMSQAALTRAIDARAADTLVRVADRIVARDAYASAGRSLLALVRAHGDAPAGSEGLAREEARDRLRLEPRIFDAIVDELVRSGAVAGRERLSVPGREAATSAADATAMAAIEATMRARGLEPLEPADLAKQTALPAVTVDRALALLIRQKRVVRLEGLSFHRDALDALVADVRAQKGDGREARVDVAGFKARYGLSRKFAIPLLEFLDRERVTRRMGDVRIVL